VHSEIYIFRSPTNALFIKLGKIKIYIKIHKHVAATRYGIWPSSGSFYWTWL